MIAARLLLAALVAAAAAASANITKESVQMDRERRPYYLFIPDSIGAAPAPLLLVFHGSNGTGRSFVEPWRDLASREQFIIAGPDAADRSAWVAPDDGPAFLYFLVEAVKARHAIDARRVYLFGHSAGAGFVLTMALMESEYFAGAAAHAGLLQRNSREQLLNAPRKIPIAMFAGTDDQLVPITMAREARDVLLGRGFPLRFVEIAGHDHNYGQRADTINREVWAFLRPLKLDDDPHYIPYNYASRR